MTILIDADGCPVVDLTLRSAGKKGVPVVILCDTAHRIEREGAQTLVFDKGADSVVFCTRQPGEARGLGCDAGLRSGKYVPGKMRAGAEPERFGIYGG
mgnify:FL=1